MSVLSVFSYCRFFRTFVYPFFLFFSFSLCLFFIRFFINIIIQLECIFKLLRTVHSELKQAAQPTQVLTWKN